MVSDLMAEWTIQKLLVWITKYLQDKMVDSARLGAEMLISEVLCKTRIQLYTDFDQTIDKKHLDILHKLVKRAGEKEPVAYLIGRTEFYSLTIKVNSSCLIPRPETELLVENAIDFLRAGKGEPLVCDLCTGSGCIAIAIGKNVKTAKIIATDISEAAISVAKENAQTHHVDDRVSFLTGNLFESLKKGEKFDLIVSNPPYVSKPAYQQLEKNVKDYEPKGALLAGEDGLDFYRQIIEKAPDFLEDHAALIMEIGYDQGQAVRVLLEESGKYSAIVIKKDFNRNDRVVMAELTV